MNEFTQDDILQIENRYQSLLKAAESRCRNEQELSVVKKAFAFTNEAHRNVRRRSGVPYIIHPLAVAEIVVKDIGLGYKSIVAALLHDLIEDTDYTVEDIRNLFGDKIASLVEGLEKIRSVLDNEDSNNLKAESIQADNFKKILLTLEDDVRVVLIKLADRLHNCRTIEYLPESKRDKVLSETMYIFVPLAHRLGLYSIKSEMENIWLRFKEPEEYLSITQKINSNIEERRGQIEEFITPIRAVLDRNGIQYTIKQRVKTPYSIWHKMRTKQVSFNQIYDLYAVRIIFNTANGSDPEAERKLAYDIYVSVTELYREQPGRMRDWIRDPKANGYEALHCTLMSAGGFWIEVQIRSKRMDDIAEKGIAAHWSYKRDGYISENDSEMDKWLAKVQNIISSTDANDLELLDLIHNELVTANITVFTPKGEQKSIENGSTALDLAYGIHSQIGNKAIAAKVNMKLVPLSYVLKAGDQVEIITAESAKPKSDWLKFVHSRKARSGIIEYFKEAQERAGSVICDVPANQDINAAGKFLSNRDCSANRKYVMAECCKPIPGDPVVGFLMGNDTVIVHKKSCGVAEHTGSSNDTRILVPQWILEQTEYPAKLNVKGIDRFGILNEITSMISVSLGMNIRSLRIYCEEGVFDGDIELLVKDRKALDGLISSIQTIEGVRDVVRVEI